MANLPLIAGYTTSTRAINETLTPTTGDVSHAVTLTLDASVSGAIPQVGDYYILYHQNGISSSSMKVVNTINGWIEIRASSSPVTAGTMTTGVWYKQLQASDISGGNVVVSLNVNNDTGRTSTPHFGGFWIRGAVNAAIGVPQDRQQHSPVNTYSAYAQPIMVPNTSVSTKALGVTLATERTIAAETTGDMQYLAGDNSAQTRWSANLFQTVGPDSTLVISTADLTDLKGSSTSELQIRWPNSHNYNAWAVQLAFESPNDPSSGLAIMRSDGSSLVTAWFKVSDGGGTLVTPGGYKVVKPGYSTVTSMLGSATPSSPFYVAHRGGSRDWPEMSLYSYGQAVLRGYGALEVSLARTSDGVWFGLHDQSINRTSGTTGLMAASSMTWAQVQAYQILGSMATNNPTQPSRPYMRIEELFELYYPSHVLFLDIKYAAAYTSEFIGIINSLSGVPQDHIVGKAFGVEAAFADAMQAAGYKMWGYYYQADAASNIATYQSHYDILGMDYTADVAAWSTVTSFGKPVIGHICPTTIATSTALGYGAVGLMCSGALAITPTSPYSNN